MLVTGDAERWIGDKARSTPLGMGGIAVICGSGEPGSGGNGIEGGGVGREVGAVVLRVEVCEADLASAIAAASGDNDSRLKFTDALDVKD